MTHLLQNYGTRIPLTFTHGETVYLFDERDKKYLDFTSGIGVMNLGYSFEAGKAAVKAQVDAIAHLSNLYNNPLQEEVADLLDQAGHYKAFFANSGAEANEAALKLARLIKPGNEILAFEDGFHGRTFGAMSATMQDKIQNGFAPLVSGFSKAIYNDVDSLKASVTPQTGAILFEVVQGEGGVTPLTAEFSAALKSCQEQGILLIVDEVQTGNGRTGKLFAFEHFGLQPDIFTTAKGLGNGLPVGAMLVKNCYADFFSAGKHGSTFGGNPLAMASARAVLTELTSDVFLADVTDKADFLKALLDEKLAGKSSVKAIRNLGLMIGIQLTDVAQVQQVLSDARAQGLLVLSAGKDIVRLLPPLVMTKAQLADGVAILEGIL
ncbi:acetylornithine transaminase [Pseudolactococcus reticulitermitis]|uniref:Acetylornithine aminotransferase n=1 Tax=Pseudolactococcus reticulitermitis TaxID=2025039 RepID=A0A224WVU7_9LACT|nr:acetylornithine transaminase [Lactococcus reticulitermitis]GAX46467.1 acetylornithine aminotransferase [Lactococcus reticulitermitis]